jgi:formylglycine-generating enzyme required for sulfatase activity
MANVMAIVSKAVFDKMVGKAKPKLGDVLSTNQYVSNNPRLESVRGGGALFLVTVRPPDEALWLVAILENPKHNGTAWVSAANAVAMTDISKLKDKLKFDSGNGIQAKPGALGMSLQTPRVLTDADVALLRAATGSAADKDGKEATEKAAPTQSSGHAKSSTPIDPWRWRAPRSHAEALSLAFWTQLNPSERARFVRAIERQSNGAISFVRGHGFGPRTVELFVHRATGTPMHLIPGGSLAMGVSASDREKLAKIEGGVALDAFVDSDALKASIPVTVAPFLLAARPLTTEAMLSLLTGDAADKSVVQSIRRANGKQYVEQLMSSSSAKANLSRLPVLEAALDAAGLRLASEAEWEWAARGGAESLTVSGDERPASAKSAPNGFGLARMGEEPELCADGWASTHEGCAKDARPRARGANGLRAVRGGAARSWSQPDGWKWLLSAARRSSADAGESLAIRPALSVKL